MGISAPRTILGRFIMSVLLFLGASLSLWAAPPGAPRAAGGNRQPTPRMTPPPPAVNQLPSASTLETTRPPVPNQPPASRLPAIPQSPGYSSRMTPKTNTIRGEIARRGPDDWEISVVWVDGKKETRRVPQKEVPDQLAWVCSHLADYTAYEILLGVKYTPYTVYPSNPVQLGQYYEALSATYGSMYEMLEEGMNNCRNLVLTITFSVKPEGTVAVTMMMKNRAGDPIVSQYNVVLPGIQVNPNPPPLPDPYLIPTP